MKESITGKVALVTGGGAGIGRAAAVYFAQNGAKIVVVDIDDEGGEETSRTIIQSGGQAIFIRADVSRTEDAKKMVKTAVEKFGRLDCACNNAGVTVKERPLTHDYPEEEWDRVININLKGVWLCMKYEIRQMLNQGSGSIVNMSSIGGLVGLIGSSAYVASKHGVAGTTKAAGLEYTQKGIRVNTVCPG
jgi:NAD(P)-dependent dehydrogenase (short-subunit alcohol dehydrogenase family)